MGHRSVYRRTVVKGLASAAVLGTVAGRAGASSTITVPDDYSTIQRAVDDADQGDTVIVEDGEYREQVIVRKDLTVRGKNNPTLRPPDGGLGVGDIAVVQPIFGAVGYGTEVDFEGFTVDGEFATDKGGFYSCVGYFKADGTIEDVTLERADYGAYLTQNLGGGGSQQNTLRNSTVREINTEPVAINERGTEAKVVDNVFEGIPGQFSFGVVSAFGANADFQRNTFRDFRSEQFSAALYIFDSRNNTVQKNSFVNCDQPIYIQADTGSRFGDGTDKNRIVKNSVTGTDSGTGTTIFAQDPDDSDDKKDTANNVKIVNNDYTDFDTGIGLFTTGDSVVQKTKIVRNEFQDVDTPIEEDGNVEETKRAANRVD